MNFGLLGHPVGHSVSPTMHAAWIRDAGLDATYQAFEIDPSTPAHTVLAAADARALTGFNLTVPFKERVLPVIAARGEVDAQARRIGAINTVCVRQGRLHGTNTDAPGFVAGVRERDPTLDRVVGRTVVVLGAGGAGRAVAVGLGQAGAARVVILNRTVPRAEAVVRSLADPSVYLAGSLEQFADWAPQASLFAVAVSGPGQAAIASLDPARVPRDALWVDLNYWSTEPPLWADLEARGIPLQDGLPMLIHQGALAFEAFTGRPADPESARAALTNRR